MTRCRSSPIFHNFKHLFYKTAWPIKTKFCVFSMGRGWGHVGLVVNTSDSRSRGQGFEPRSGRRVVSLSKTYLSPKKVLVIPRKRWLRPNMTEKLFTGTLSIKPNETMGRGNENLFAAIESHDLDGCHTYIW